MNISENLEPLLLSAKFNLTKVWEIKQRYYYNFSSFVF